MRDGGGHVCMAIKPKDDLPFTKREKKKQLQSTHMLGKCLFLWCSANVLLNISLKYQSLSPCHTHTTYIEDLKIREVTLTHTCVHRECTQT